MSDILRLHCPVFLSGFLDCYSQSINESLPEEIPTLKVYLAARGRNDPGFLAGGLRLDSEVDGYRQLLKDNGITVPEPDEFWRRSFRKKAAESASRTVNKGFVKYKDRKAQQNPEKAQGNTCCDDIASSIARFFEALAVQERLLCGEDLMYVLDFALRDDFLERIIDYAAERGNFNAGSLSDICTEIVVYTFSRLYNERIAKTGNAA